MKIKLFTAFFLFFNFTFSQVLETPPPNFIKTINFRSGENLGGIPILKLGEQLILEFDDIIGDEANYYYVIEHYNFDWTPSSMAKSEYLLGFDNVRITNYENSFNTLVLFSHYRMKIPNEDTRGLKLSGNYMIKIFDANENLVFSRKFIVYEPLVTVPVAIKRSRNIKFIDSKQVVQFSIDSPNLLLKNPKENVKTLVLQNNNIKTAISGLVPQYNIGTELIYKYDQESAFWAGNEYIEFDNKDLRSANMNIRSVSLDEIYHHYLYTDIVRAFRPYTYNPDVNGGFLIRTMQGSEPDIEAEYVWVHFSLQNYQAMDDAELHIYGAFNNFEITDETKLNYNPETTLYEKAMLVKQGFYNYKYVAVKKDGSIIPGFISGNYDETENDYKVVVYYRDVGARYDRVIGVGNASSVNISN